MAYREQEEYRISEKQYTVKAEELTLNDQQQRVPVTRCWPRCGRRTPGVTLLRGVTGSGKTVVYIRLAQELLKIGRSVMILVPEIALTPQMMARFTAYFGHDGLLHSGLRMTERYDQFKRLRRGEAHIVLGTRSAVFAPLERLGLIILDEEQESSYESEKRPLLPCTGCGKIPLRRRRVRGCCWALPRPRWRRFTTRSRVSTICWS